MAFYTIKELESISGIKAHTIRMWEQRYNLLSPERTDTNIRRYSDEDFKKLLNVVSLMNLGMKISKIGELSSQQIELEVLSNLQKTNDEDAYESWINALVVTMVNFDEEGFEVLFSQLSMKFGLREVFIRVIYPFLRKVGYLWVSEGLMPAQEHFVSNLIRQKLFTAIDNLSLDKSRKETFVLFLPEDEDHEIALLFSSWIIQSFGIKVIYLGQRVPIENLQETIHSVGATHMMTFFIGSGNRIKVKKQINDFLTQFPDVTLYYSGSEVLLNDVGEFNNAHWLKDVRDLEKIL